MDACNLNENTDDVSTLFICYKHFAVDDYVDSNAKQFGGVTRLKPGAVSRTKFITNKLQSLHTCVSEQELVSAETQIFTNLPGTSSNLANKELNICSLVSEIYVCKPNTASKHIPDLSDLPTSNTNDECNLQSPCTPKKRKFVLPRHSGNLTEEDFGTPRKTKRNLQLLKSTIAMKQRRLEMTQQQNRRLKRKIASLKELLSHLHIRNLISEEAEQTIMVSIP
ncbi:hypothetical protein NQ314_013969 [Rhamnusium bicolor]|uniref:THAP-type domain-containing protein n=1 Tax=Rhamnusium bicolor TaxID=1586634 RepID=A0AAV8X3A2_9CUCU|nr:hypothetical protein NQ314_013969 [Rhamnusium bicolor]